MKNLTDFTGLFLVRTNLVTVITDDFETRVLHVYKFV